MTEVARREQGGQGLAVQQAGSTLADTLQLGEVLVASGFLPKAIRSKEQAAAIILKGKELALPPMQALSHIHIVEGKPTLSAELMVALVQRAGHTLRVVETSSERAVVDGIRVDDPNHTSRIEWTMQDAQRANVAGKGPWKSYPDAMLRARAISALCRFAFADVLAGCSYVPEELGVEVDSEGAVIEPPAPVAAVESSANPTRDTAAHHSAPEVTPQKLRQAWTAIEKEKRPDWLGYVWPAYQSDPQATLSRLQEIAADDDPRDDVGQAAGEPRWIPDEEKSGADEADQEAEQQADLLGDDQLTYISDIAEELYADENSRYDGKQYLERRIGQALTTLTRDEATALIRQLDSEYKEAMDSE